MSSETVKIDEIFKTINEKFEENLTVIEVKVDILIKEQNEKLTKEDFTTSRTCGNY